MWILQQLEYIMLSLPKGLSLASGVDKDKHLNESFFSALLSFNNSNHSVEQLISAVSVTTINANKYV